MQETKARPTKRRIPLRNSKSDDTRNRERSVKQFKTINSTFQSVDINSLEKQLKTLLYKDLDIISKVTIENVIFDPTKALIDIYPQIKEDITIFDGTLNFTHEDSPIRVLKTILSYYSEVNTKTNWNISFNKDQYTLAISYDINDPIGGHGFCFIDFYRIRKEEPVVFDLALQIFAVLKSLGACLWDSGTSGYASEMLEQEIFQEEYEDEEQTTEMQKCYDYYEKGTPAQISKEIDAIEPSAESIESMIKHLGDSELHTQMKEFAKVTAWLENSGHTMEHFIDPSVYEDGDVLSPIEWYSLIWHIHEDDPIWLYSTEAFQSEAENNCHRSFSAKGFLNESEESFNVDFITNLNKAYDLGCTITNMLNEEHKSRFGTETTAWNDPVSVR